MDDRSLYLNWVRTLDEYKTPVKWSQFISQETAVFQAHGTDVSMCQQQDILEIQREKKYANEKVLPMATIHQWHQFLADSNSSLDDLRRWNFKYNRPKAFYKIEFRKKFHTKKCPISGCTHRPKNLQGFDKFTYDAHLLHSFLRRSIHSSSLLSIFSFIL